MNSGIKKEIKKQLIKDVENLLIKAKISAGVSLDLSVNGDVKSDGKYDTRAIEAGYLAGAQRKRVTELEQELNLLKDMNVEVKQNFACIGSLITLMCGGKSRDYFLSSGGGGKILNVQEKAILVISVFSPIGDGALNLEIEDEFEVKVGDSVKIYKIVNIS